MKKLMTEVLIIKNQARLEKMIREKFPQKRITQQKKRLEELKAQI